MTTEEPGDAHRQSVQHGFAAPVERSGLGGARRFEGRPRGQFGHRGRHVQHPSAAALAHTRDGSLHEQPGRPDVDLLGGRVHGGA